MCWEIKSPLFEGRGEKVADDQARDMRAKRAGIVDALAADANKTAPKAAPETTPAKETAPAE